MVLIILVILLKYLMLVIATKDGETLVRETNISSIDQTDLFFYNISNSIASSIKSIDDRRNYVILPTIWLYVIGVIMLIMLSIIIYCAVILYKIKNRKYERVPSVQFNKLNIDNNDNTVTSKQREFYRMNSSDKSSFNHIEINDSTSVKYQGSKMRQESDKSISNIPEASTKDDSKNNVKAIILNKKLPLISPEQMTEICNAVLGKTRTETGSMQDLEKSLKTLMDGKDRDKETKKCASSPVLDDMVDYDVVSSHPVTVVDLNKSDDTQIDYDVISKPPVPVGNLSEFKDAETVSSYDTISVSQNIIVKDNDTYYLLPISGRESKTYINAKTNSN